MQVKNVAAAIDQRRDRGHVLQQGLLGQFAQRQLGRQGCLASRAAPRSFSDHGGRNRPSARALRALEIFLALVDLGLAVQHGKQVDEFAQAVSEVPRNNKPPGCSA